jgi:hypothetical protein
MIVGTLLILLGGLFLLGQATGFWPLGWLTTEIGWPFIVIAVGALFFVGMVAGGRDAGSLAIPGSIITGTGLVLLALNATDQWQAMAYAWTLIAPTSIGVGFMLWGLWADQPERVRQGQRLTTIGLALFLGLAAFFELVINLSGFFVGSITRIGLPLLLIGLGLLLLLRRGERPSWR